MVDAIFRLMTSTELDGLSIIKFLQNQINDDPILLCSYIILSDSHSNEEDAWDCSQ